MTNLEKQYPLSRQLMYSFVIRRSFTLCFETHFSKNGWEKTCFKKQFYYSINILFKLPSYLLTLNSGYKMWDIPAQNKSSYCRAVTSFLFCFGNSTEWLINTNFATYTGAPYMSCLPPSQLMMTYVQTEEEDVKYPTKQINKANTYKSRARLSNLEWLRMPRNDLECLRMT